MNSRTRRKLRLECLEKRTMMSGTTAAGMLSHSLPLAAPASALTAPMYQPAALAVAQTATVATSTPQAPTNLATSYIVNALKLTWNPSANVAGYEVYRGTSNNAGAATKIVTTTDTTFNDTSAAAGVTYWYFVKARSSSGVLSNPSNGVSAVGPYQCAGYVARAKGLLPNYPNAYQFAVSYVRNCVCYPPFLQQNGYVKVSAPTVGAVVVFQPGFGHGVDATNGHVGIIAAAQAIKSSSGAVTGWTITVRGANQGGNVFSDSGVPNVSNWTLTVATSETQISYWVKG